MNRKIKGNDLFVFFEIIEQLEPEKALDIGLLLKRAGCVCRKAFNCEFSEDLWLDGVYLAPELRFKVEKNIYNKTKDIREFMQQIPKSKYDCTFVLGFYVTITDPLLVSLLIEAPKYSRYLLSDHSIKEWSDKSLNIIHLAVNDDNYYLFDFGE